MKVIFFHLLLILCSLFVQAQDYMPLLAIDSVKVEIKIEKHLWEDNRSYQFISISVSGLQEINTSYSHQPSDRINPSLISSDSYGGAYGPIIPMSRNKTFYPVKTIKEIVYDSTTNRNIISKSNVIKHTSLFLMDDFDDVKSKETLILFSRGCFGYQRQSYAACKNFTSEVIFDKSLLDTDNDFPIANKNWYHKWLYSAPEEHTDGRTIYQYGDIHEDFETYLNKN